MTKAENVIVATSVGIMQNRRAKRDDYKPSAVRVTQRYMPWRLGITIL
ncbi:hypothetical protein [Piscirickettsia salmonis]|nr:hypothetical protein [Piscirickettsia salmonis]